MKKNNNNDDFFDFSEYDFTNLDFIKVSNKNFIKYSGVGLTSDDVDKILNNLSEKSVLQGTL